MSDCLIIGGGVIGLSIAYQLARDGMRATVIDRGELGHEASWAGAGMLPPARRHVGDTPLDQLAALAVELHPVWADDLSAATGIDTGYRRTGALYVARQPPELPALHGAQQAWAAADITASPCSTTELRELEPELASIAAATFVPAEAQLRNPRHLRALQQACGQLGVVLRPGVAAESVVWRSGQVVGVQTSAGLLAADRYCVTAGPWTTDLLGPMWRELSLPPARVQPVRGQIALLETARPLPRHIINVGSRYLVPRGDGLVLVGSTEEQVGFDRQTTSAGVDGLLDFARELFPALAEARLVRAWAGLRPASADGLPYLGQVPGVANLWVAAGHYRAGLTQSTGTAVLMSQLLRGRPTTIDMTPFRLDRG